MSNSADIRLIQTCTTHWNTLAMINTYHAIAERHLVASAEARKTKYSAMEFWPPHRTFQAQNPHNCQPMCPRVHRVCVRACICAHVCLLGVCVHTWERKGSLLWSNAGKPSMTWLQLVFKLSHSFPVWMHSENQFWKAPREISDKCASSSITRRKIFLFAIPSSSLHHHCRCHCPATKG